jgi:hypothetical protein
MFKVNDYEVSFKYSEDGKHRRVVDCYIHTDNGGWLGQSVCSKVDQFVKAEGRKLAFTRAIQPFDRETRTLFWNKYFELCKRG